MAGTSRDRCPTQAEILPQLLALLPRGRAWGTHEGALPATTVISQFWNSVASVFERANQRICALREEFWCATHVETDDLWLLEYGLPDACDPFPDLCAKVAAIGGTRCDYFAQVALAAGWAVRCPPIDESCGTRAGCGRAGTARAASGDLAAVILIEVDLSESPAYVAPTSNPPRVGCLRAGRKLRCADPVDISSLICVLERVVPAHVRIAYRLIQPPVYWAVDDFDNLATESGATFVME